MPSLLITSLDKGRAKSKELRVKAVEIYRKVLDLERGNVRAKDRIEKISKEFIW